MAGVIIPKTYVTMITDPLIFLAGPILGAPNWQDKAIEILFSQNHKNSPPSSHPALKCGV
jgi:hypothetical protein